MSAEIVDLAARRAAKASTEAPQATEQLRAKVPKRFAGCFTKDDEWLRNLAAKVRCEIGWDMTAEQIIEIAAVVDRVLGGGR